MTEVQKWIEAGIKLGRNKNAKVLCPSCSKSFLVTKDEPIPKWKQIDRFLNCELCGGGEVMTGNFEDSDFYFTDEKNTL